MARSSFVWLALAPVFHVRSESNQTLGGGWLPKIDSNTWEGFEPSADFVQQFNAWPDRKTPDEIQVWCKGFIPNNATSEVVNGHPVMPIKGPLDVPIPGLLGKCAMIDGRGWSSNLPAYQRPNDARFWGHLSVVSGSSREVTANANCGMSEGMCCEQNGCGDGSKFGDISCRQHCPDSEMAVKKLACWTGNTTQKGQNWPLRGEPCASTGGSILAAKVYIKGRGGDPCVTVVGVHSPVASWDVGLAVFPTKRKVTITGYVDDAPSYECYAKARDDGVWGPSVTLAQLPMDMSRNVALELVGYSNRPVNPHDKFFDLPTPKALQELSILV